MDAAAGFGGLGFDTFLDDLSIGKDRTDRVAVSFEEPCDPQVLGGGSSDSDGVVHQCKSWRGRGTRHGQTGVSPGAATGR
jgi:hypothetical protein